MKTTVLALLLLSASALAQPSPPALPPAIPGPPARPVEVPMPAPVSPQPLRSNGSSGWVNSKPQSGISPADVAAMFRPLQGGR